MLRSTPAGAGFAGEGNRRWAMGLGHPRGCGVCGGRPWAGSLQAGSTPAGAGFRGSPTVRRGVSGSTPAGAGFAAGRESEPSENEVHPRGRGGFPFGAPRHLRFAGPPPRVRGWRAPILPRPLLSWSTPAGAGFAYHVPVQSCPIEVHPRGCGVCDWSHGRRPNQSGPPPRVRGLRS